MTDDSQTALTWEQIVLSSFPAVPEDAPEAFKARITAMRAALVDLHCPECLRYGTIESGEDGNGRPFVSANFDHFETCPLNSSQLRGFARSLGYDWQFDLVPFVDLSDENALSQVIDRLDIEIPDNEA